MLHLTLNATGSNPSVVHAHGQLSYKPYWKPIFDGYFKEIYSPQRIPDNLTIITCNNGNAAMGCFEKSLSHMQVSPLVLGHGIEPWINSRDKPRLIAEAAKNANTEYMMYADSRDAILIHPPAVVLEKYTNNFACDLLFGGDRLSWPPIPEFQKYEQNLPYASQSEFKYLNGGGWIGRTDFIKIFFESVCKCEPHPMAPESEQGLLRKVFREYGDKAAIDSECNIFLNIGFLFAPGAVSLGSN